jgi:SAM-dependent methyltransferase
MVEDVELAGFYGEGYGSHGEVSNRVYAMIWGGLKRAQVRAILRRSPFTDTVAGTPGRALDVGCGRGDLAAGLIARRWRVDGIEPSPRAAGAALRQGVHIVGSSLASATLASDGYDLAVFRHSLEHVSDPLAAMSRVREALRPGGCVVISVPNFASWQRRRFGACWFHLDLPRHRVHFTPSSLAIAVRSADLAIRTTGTSTSVLGLPASLQYALVGRCLAPAGVRLHLSTAFCSMLFPVTRLVDQFGGERDTIHLVAERC